AWRERGGGLLHWTRAFFSEAVDARRVAGGPHPKTRMVNMVQIGRALTDPELAPPIRALFVFDSNPASIAPNSSLVRRGLARDDPFLDGITYERLKNEGWAPLSLPGNGPRFAEGGFPTPSGRCDLFGDPEPAYLPPVAPAGLPLVMVSAKTALHFLNTSYA